ncbi:MAG TPA: oligogalacturonate lyase family protein, partial [Bryobacteraceae bacterium]|nr:oligogalacturonate lyase family protein [Bryobacteraceae bacterium]
MHARSRRWFLSILPAATGLAAETPGKGRTFPATLHKFPDPSTEFPVVRLTDPAFTAVLPQGYNRPVAKHSNFLLLASNFTGRFEVFRMDLKNGQSRQLTEAENLAPSALAMLPEDRGFLYVDGDRV